VHAVVDRYRLASPIGRVQAIEIWNEPNLTRQWGGQPINQQSAADYVRLLSGAYLATKSAESEYHPHFGWTVADRRDLWQLGR
jgi:hypothetical protein